MHRGCILLLSSAILCAQTTARIDIDAGRPVHPVPRTVFGAFMEPLRSAIDGGGLSAQLLENPSLEDNLWSADAIVHMVKARPELARASKIGLPIPWESLDPEQGSRFEPRWGDAANSFRSLLLMALPDRQTGVRQAIYPPVHRVLRYSGSIWARPVSGPRQIEISLRKRNRVREILAKTEIALRAGGWERYEYALELPPRQLASREPADFTIAVSGEARVLIDQVLLYPADHIDGLNPEAVEMTKALRIPVLRFGGNYTSGYHWRDGIGPIDKRVSMLNIVWGQPEYNHFGTDEFLRFCQLTGARPQICLNMGSGTLEEAVEWVKYVNQRSGTQGLTWELGNELWGTFQIGYPTLERVAERTRLFSEAVRKADPLVKLIATGQDPDRFEKWNAAQLALGPEYFNSLATHLVIEAGAVRKPNPSPKFVAEAMFAIPTGVERMLQLMKSQIDADPRMRSRTGLALTEYLFRAPFSPAPPDFPPPRIPEYRNMGGAIWAAGMLNMLMRVADFTPLANMTGIVEYGRLWEKRGITYGVPAYWAFRMYSTAEAANLLATKTDVARYSVTDGSPRVPNVPDVPYLDVVAASNQAGDRLTLFVVNRHLSADIRAAIRIAGFSVGSASGSVLSAQDIYVGNDDAQPENVIPRNLQLAVSGTEFSHEFPRASVTVLVLRK
jgi:alpha-L-arabinofuranosidase